MGRGNSTPQSQTTEVQLPAGAQTASSLGNQQLGLFADLLGGGTLQAPSQSGVAGFDPLQIQAQNEALGARGTQQNLVSSGAEATNFLLGDSGADVLFADTNPALRERSQFLGDEAVRQATELGEGLNIRNEAVNAGQFGGSRQALAEGKLAEATLRQALGAQAGLESTAFGQGLDAIRGQQALIPGLSAAQLQPSLTTGGVGDVRRNLAQALLGEQISREQFEQLAPLLTAQQLFNTAQGVPGGSITTTATQPETSGLNSALGGAAAGASIGSAFGPVGTGVGAAGGALLSYLLA